MKGGSKVDEDLKTARHISQAMMAVGCLAVIFSGILLLNGIDYLMIVWGKQEQCLAKPSFYWRNIHRHKQGRRVG